MITKRLLKRGTDNRLKPPAKWVKKIKDDDIRNIVEQEYYISKSRALKISKGKTLAEAKKIRAKLLDEIVTIHKKNNIERLLKCISD